MRSAVSHWLAVAVGGACGAALRHLLDLVLRNDPVVWGTVVVNVVGAFVLGVVASRPDGPIAALFWRTGVLGSFTTFSSMTAETVTLGPVTGLAYLVGLTAVGAAVIGVRTGIRVHRREAQAGP